jgi:hypothetical protein
MIEIKLLLSYIPTLPCTEIVLVNGVWPLLTPARNHNHGNYSWPGT